MCIRDRDNTEKKGRSGRTVGVGYISICLLYTSSASFAGVSAVTRDAEPEVTVQETSGAVGTSDTSEAASKEVSSAEAGSFESGSGQAPAEIEHGTVQVSDEPAETVSDVSSVTDVYKRQVYGSI